MYAKKSATAFLIRTVPRARVSSDRWHAVAADCERFQPLQAQSRYYNRNCASEYLHAGEAEDGLRALIAALEAQLPSLEDGGEYLVGRVFPEARPIGRLLLLSALSIRCC